MDIKLKDILNRIKTHQQVQFEFESGERCYIPYSDIFKYLDYYVINIWNNREAMVLAIRKDI